MNHVDNLARVQALRDVVTFDNVRTGNSAATGPAEPAVLDHIEDVLTRHAPVPSSTVWSSYDMRPKEPGSNTLILSNFDAGSVEYVGRTCYQGWPCPDYASALRLLDALDGGAP